MNKSVSKHGNAGRTFSKDHRRKLSEASKGRTHSEETRRKMSQAKKGRTYSKEHKRKISKSLRGKKHPHYGRNLSEEHRRKMSEAHKGNSHTEETKRKLSEVMSGKNNSNWKGGVSFYYGDNWSYEKRCCIERDQNTCQLCGKTKEQNSYKGSLGKLISHDMSVHHIIPFREFVRKARKTDYNKANELRNLVCLCSTCHKKADSKQSYVKHKGELQQIAIRNTEQFLRGKLDT